ncbi:uncharacterized protein LOC129216619 [Uloborus diversus]|uniref:uncharacterized protein LOC129216619 n=1 Tax=Uloborus diversus TaxID=327109 RepID=UPI00240955BD|nr:uncharacterized protein LOC129216619 [Uloborus diversus]
MCSRDLLTIHLRIANSLSAWDWYRIEHLTYNTMIFEKEITSRRQIRKFEKLPKHQHPIPTLNDDRTEVNLSNHQLSADEISVLKRGGNFAVVPKYIPVEDIVANIEAGLHKLPKDVSADIHREASRILQRANTPRSNITAQERRALKQLKSNQDIVILATYKGNATAVLNTKDYQDKIQELLDPDIYRSLQVWSSPSSHCKRH